MYGHFEQSSLRTLEELINISISLSTEKDPNRLLTMILTSARRFCSADSGRIYLLDATKKSLFIEVYQDKTDTVSRPSAHTLDLFIGNRPNLANICCFCAFSGKIINIPDAYTYSGFNFTELYERDRRTGYSTKSVLAAPLRNHEGITAGVLELVNAVDPRTGKVIPFPSHLEGLVKAFASQAAVAIHNVQLISEKRRLIEILDHTNRRLEMENLELRKQIKSQSCFKEIIGNSPAMKNVFCLMGKVLNSDATVLITGETGCGKEMVASAIHSRGHRSTREFVALNCANLAENLLESELFGYTKGAFTGAVSDKKGLMEVASNGTLFLDEIGDMPVGVQAKLLRALQEGEIRPLGSTRNIKVSPRIIAATHRDLRTMIRSGEFREDLYYRLSIFPIAIPPLRDRPEDIPDLIYHFLRVAEEKYGKTLTGFSPAAMQMLLEYNYPGNVRELQNIVERVVLMADQDGAIVPDLIPDYVRERRGHTVQNEPISPFQQLKDAVAEYEKSVIRQKLDLNNWNQTRTAKELAIPRRTLIDKMNRYGLKRSKRPPYMEGEMTSGTDDVHPSYHHESRIT